MKEFQERSAEHLKNATSCFGALLPERELPDEIRPFHSLLKNSQVELGQIVDLMEMVIANKDIIEQKKLLKNIRISLSALTHSVVKELVKEKAKIEKQTRIKTAEVEASIFNTKVNASYALIGALALALTTGLSAWLAAGRTENKSNSPDLVAQHELFSEYRVRLGETENQMPRLFSTNETNVNLDKTRNYLLSVIQGGYARTKDTRSELGWQRIIRDLQQTKTNCQRADAAANAVLNLEGKLNQPPPYEFNSFNTNLNELKLFAVTNGF
jgi:hypothetical protein